MQTTLHADLIITLSCPDKPGIVYSVSGTLFEAGCNIIESGQFTDPGTNVFFMRLAISYGEKTDIAKLKQSLTGELAAKHGMRISLRDPHSKLRVLVMVSKFGHCLNDLLFRHTSGTLPVDIPLVVSNHRDFEKLATVNGIPFQYLPVTAATKAEQEAKLLQLIEEYNIDLVVLARYMQVLSNELCAALDGRAINIHHSFLPSFKGAKPYHQAYERGVKFIGATAHYVTADLDEGPIIEQDVARADHTLGPDGLIATGRDIESVVLARAVQLHAEGRVMLSGHRTIIFR